MGFRTPTIKTPSFFKTPWFLSALLLAIFFISSSYKYGWDDQHLEIPLLRSLIDHSFYQGDYYVESLRKNFSSFFYPILARFISIDQIPSVYFFLYVIVRYFLFFWVYKLWLLISKSRFKAFCCVSTFILFLRVPEFFYRTFSHQEFALAIIFAGIYYFFKERFFLAALLLGLTANIHALYSLFPFVFMSAYLLTQFEKYGFRTLLKVVVIFCVASLPFLIWTIQNRFDPTSSAASSVAQADWMAMYIKACPQNFIFPAAPQIPVSRLFSSWRIFYNLTQPYLFLIVLFILNIVFNPRFRENKKAIFFCLSAFDFLILCVIFTYCYPNRFVLDLNLARNTQFLLFLLAGFTTIFVADRLEKDGVIAGLCLVGLWALLKMGGFLALCSIGSMFFLIWFLRSMEKKEKDVILLTTRGIAVAGFLGCGYGIWHTFEMTLYKSNIKVMLMTMASLLIINAIIGLFLRKGRYARITQRMFLIIPLAVFLVQFGIYRGKRLRLEQEGGGFWEMQRNWEDMQRYVKENTPREALLLVPYNMEMGGFRILSERKIICSYRDCGIVGFDYSAALEWQKRVKDIEDFKFIVKEFPTEAVKNAIIKYHADYIVFMSYALPNGMSKVLHPIYSNKYYSLYKVMYRKTIFRVKDSVPVNESSFAEQLQELGFLDRLKRKVYSVSVG